MSTTQDTFGGTATERHDPLARWLPLAGVAYAVLAVVGTLTIDAFPDEDTTTQTLVGYYAEHHAQVARGGQIMMLSGLFFGLFAAALVARARRHPAIAAVIGVGAAASLTVESQSDATFALLGQVSVERHVDPAAVQAWHIGAAAYGTSVPTVLFLLGVVLAALVARALPAWLGWTALVLGLGLLVPGLVGFFASMLVWPWALAAGIALARRSPTPFPTTT